MGWGGTNTLGGAVAILGKISFSERAGRRTGWVQMENSKGKRGGI